MDKVPKLPYKFRMKNVKWLIWVSLTMLDIWSEQVVIWLLVPLREKKSTQSSTEDHTVKRAQGSTQEGGIQR